MAFNLRSLGVCSLTSVFFVVVLLGSLLWNYISFSLFFFLVALGCLHEFNNLLFALHMRPLRLAGYLCAVLLYALFLHKDMLGLSGPIESLRHLPLLFAPLIIGLSVFSRKPNSFAGALSSLSGVIYCVLPFALMHQLVRNEEGGYDPAILLSVILLIWANDTFAYLGGNLLGKRKLAERISPGKTWEGTFTGILVSFGLSFVIPRITGAPWQGPLWPVLGIVVPVLATVGDLAQSLLKRQAGVKDSGSIMPGHGGLLDRFDSLIFVAPVVVTAFALLQLH